MRFSSFTLSRPVGEVFFDQLQLDPCGLIRIVGWSRIPVQQAMIPQVMLDGQPIPLLQQYGVTRRDVEMMASQISPVHAGLVLEYLLPQALAQGSYQSISISLPPYFEAAFRGRFDFVDAHYRPLLDRPEVLHREHIYGVGPPNVAVNAETLNLALKLPGPVLDFGCGSGALIAELQRAGIQAHGLEMQSPMILNALPPELKPSVTLYDGSFPAPFANGSFRSVFCSEVLEHIPDFRGAIRDIARIVSDKVIFTVPDASAIPIGFRHSLVPWHLMEASHLNFFNQSSLAHELKPYFSRVEFGRVGECRFNDSPFSSSLVAICWK